jgi:NADH:ubiquinone oxidoreductase subunit 5 (subunit L)/multisubunit Na+/H+ antiporter MnhA subunit
VAALAAVMSLLPLALCVASAALAASSRRRAAQWVGIAGLLAAALSAIWLYPRTDYAPLIALRWPPTGEAMSIAPGPSGLLAIALTIGAGAMLMAIHDQSASRWTPAIWLLATGGTAIALVADHFALRYIALELVALSVPLALLAEGPDRIGPAASSYILLRLGDAALLAAILMLDQGTGTLDIEQALELGAELPALLLGTISALLLLASWIKVGAWPFHTWHLTGARHAPTSNAWIHAIAAAVLGVYLLYRVSPLLAGSPVATVAAGLASLAALISAIRAAIDDDPSALSVYVNSWSVATALACAALGLKGFTYALIPMITIARAGATLSERSGESTGARRIAVALRALSSATLLAMTFVALTALAREGHTALLILIGSSWALAGLGMARAIRDTRTRTRSQGSRSPHTAALAATGVALLVLLIILPTALDWLGHQIHAEIPLASTGKGAMARILLHPALWAALLLAIATGLNARVPVVERTRQRVASLLSGGNVEKETRQGLEGFLMRLAGGIDGLLEKKLIASIQGMLDIATKTAGALHWFEESVLNRGLTRAVEGIAGLATATDHMEGAIQSETDRIAQALFGLARSMQRLHTGKLRHNLLWVAMALLVGVLAALLLLEGGAS